MAPSDAVPELERVVRRLQLPGQRQLHFQAESPSRRREIIDVIVRSGLVHAWVYSAARPLVPARRRCLQAIATNLASAGVGGLILDNVDDRQALRDRSAIHEVVKDVRGELRYRHAPAHQVAGVQVADVVAWAYGAGRDWRRRVRPLIVRAVDLA
jgi:hypothetical protein